VLIVDDMQDNRDLFAMVVDHLGYRVELAIDGVDAVERARRVHPTVILMDLAMPNMDGFEATRRIRAIQALASVHIIAISAFSDDVNVQRALAAGCNEVLAKPCRPDVLANRISARSRMDRVHARDAG
jgi:CheY-like chemotaxis protein